MKREKSSEDREDWDILKKWENFDRVERTRKVKWEKKKRKEKKREETKRKQKKTKEKKRKERNKLKKRKRYWETSFKKKNEWKKKIEELKKCENKHVLKVFDYFKLFSIIRDFFFFCLIVRERTIYWRNSHIRSDFSNFRFLNDFEMFNIYWKRQFSRTMSRLISSLPPLLFPPPRKKGGGKTKNKTKKKETSRLKLKRDRVVGVDPLIIIVRFVIISARARPKVGFHPVPEVLQAAFQRAWAMPPFLTPFLWAIGNHILNVGEQKKNEPIIPWFQFPTGGFARVLFGLIVPHFVDLAIVEVVRGATVHSIHAA